MGKIITGVFALLIIVSVTANLLTDERKIKAVVTIQATNNTLVPSILYTVDAVECLREAVSVYADETLRATAYAELFAEKHNGTWNVVVGYTTILTHSSVYVEVSVDDGGKQYSKDPKKSVLYRIFN